MNIQIVLGFIKLMKMGTMGGYRSAVVTLFVAFSIVVLPFCSAQAGKKSGMRWLFRMVYHSLLTSC